MPGVGGCARPRGWGPRGIVRGRRRIPDTRLCSHQISCIAKIGDGPMHPTLTCASDRSLLFPFARAGTGGRLLPAVGVSQRRFGASPSSYGSGSSAQSQPCILISLYRTVIRHGDAISTIRRQEGKGLTNACPRSGARNSMSIEVPIRTMGSVFLGYFIGACASSSHTGPAATPSARLKPAPRMAVAVDHRAGAISAWCSGRWKTGKIQRR